MEFSCICKDVEIIRTVASRRFRDKCKELVITEYQFQELERRFLNCINKGLGKKTRATSIVKCSVTYIQDLPTGREKGEYLALDFSGTSIRIVLIGLSGDLSEIQSETYDLPQYIIFGTGKKLFDYIAECLAKFMKEHNIMQKALPLGFCFNFPIIQTSLTIGILEGWTKGIHCSEVIGNDVVQLLKESLARRGDLKIKVCAILNETTGTLMSCAWKNHNCRMSLTIGNTSSACYLENQKNVGVSNEDNQGSRQVAINTEWGTFGDDGKLDFIRTEYDDNVDINSINSGKQLFEKMISGMYMGELVRLALERFTDEGLLFNGKGSNMLSSRYRFYNKYVFEIESEPPGSFIKCHDILEQLQINHITDQDCTNVRYVCECVSRRAAQLVSVAVATLLKKMNVYNVSIGIDGSLYKYHPQFHNILTEKIGELVPNIKFELLLSENGGALGAAIVAAIASRKQKKSETTINEVTNST